MYIKRNVSLQQYTTFKVGGVASHFFVVKNEKELVEALVYAKKEHLPVIPLGGGSNVLITADVLEALVIKNEIKGIEWSDTTVRVGAGENWDIFVKEAGERGYWGLENLSGIPGTVGGAPVQNIGAYGKEVKDVISTVETYHLDTAEKRIFSPEECRFSYRESFFKTEEGKKYFITTVVFSLLEKGVPAITYKDLKNYFGAKMSPTLLEIRNAVLEIRSQKFPDLTKVGTAGSFFKNPIVDKNLYDRLKEQYPDLPGFPISDPSRIKDQGLKIKIPLAWVLENVLGKKGYREGDVALFERQPLVLVNYGNATAEEIEMFASKIEQEVFEKTGIKIEREVNCI